ncbi:hypothetical protein ACFVS2_20395 [Brevibacillus sp. NPDC058079]|uniref:hypothetical protein n=1 Tax=Brevibacillus sp. NPDC058079 TaxID=3346330 RepID=UPI0036E47188
MKEIFSKTKEVKVVSIQYETMTEYEKDREERVRDGWHETGYVKYNPYPCITWRKEKLIVNKM